MLTSTAEFILEKLNEKCDIDYCMLNQAEVIKIIIDASNKENELENHIATINSYINAITDILADNTFDKDFITAILRQVKSIKAILRKEVLK